ncbi:MAG: class I SAM-dependent methyltransferase [Pseudonocardia sp.]
MKSAEYVFGTDQAEIARLLDSAAARRPPADRLLDRLGDMTGWAVLDAGCGPLGILDLLAERVGPTGTVTGVDRAAPMVAAARRVLDGRGLTGVRLACADIAALPIPDAVFDLAHERLVLVNLAEAPRAVGELARVTRPGGVVALQEFDHVSLICHPPHPAWDALMAAWHGCAATRGWTSPSGATCRACSATPGSSRSRCTPRCAGPVRTSGSCRCTSRGCTVAGSSRRGR